MHTRTILPLTCALLWIIATSFPAQALNRLAIDGLHGQLNLYGHLAGPNLPAIYPESRFTFFGSEQLPLYDVIAEGHTTHAYYDSVNFVVPAGATALYAIVSGYNVYPPQPPSSYPFVTLRLPDQSTMTGCYGFTHVDSPPPGSYTLFISHQDGSFPYRIGTGPCIWNVYPLSDYDALLDFQNNMYGYWVGFPPPRSRADMTAINAAMNEGTGVGLFYDGCEPIADKPIIHLSGLADKGATVRINLPGRLTMALPEPQNSNPLEWQVAPTSGDVELDYEAQLRGSLNFVWSAYGSGTVENRSWATAHDLKLISFEAGKGYRIAEVGTLAPGASATALGGAAVSFQEALSQLDGMMHAEALKAGLTAHEGNSFFARCAWPLRILSRVSAEPGQMAVYYLDGADYDAIFPLETDPAPADCKRVLWVHSYLPARVTEPAGVFPQGPAPSAHVPGARGSYHEYGALRETYGGDALDDLDMWGWHFYDYYLIDTTNVGFNFSDWGTWGSVLFHHAGGSPLASMLMAGVTNVNGAFTGPIAAPAYEVVLSGDEDTYCYDHTGNCPYPQGSYPPVVVARQMPSGARIIAGGDFTILDTLADNVQFGRNVWNAFHHSQTENVPDIDVPDAIIDYELSPGHTGQSVMWVHNRGDAQLQTNFQPPQVDWLHLQSELPRSISPGDSFGFLMQWSAEGLTSGYYMGWWNLASNDPNEGALLWPVRLHVLGEEAVDPAGPNLPSDFALYPAFPNPFNPVTTIRYYLPRASDVRLEINNLMGQQVDVLASGRQETGYHSVAWNGQNHASGLYVCRLRAGERVMSQKMVLAK